jgi:hypothetical protein
MKLYTSQKHIGWKPTYTEGPAKQSKGRVFAARRQTSFTRPPAIYGNQDSEAIRDKYINMELTEKKRRKP